MAEGEGAAEATHHSAGKGIKGFMSAEFAGLPVWVWLLIVGGVGVAVFLVPKLMGGSGNTSAATDQGSAAANNGMAIDPSTGLPYAVEGSVGYPQGAISGQGGQTSDMTQTNALLQQLIALESQNTPPPGQTTGGSGAPGGSSGSGGSSGGTNPPPIIAPGPGGVKGGGQTFAASDLPWFSWFYQDYAETAKARGQTVQAQPGSVTVGDSWYQMYENWMTHRFNNSASGVQGARQRHPSPEPIVKPNITGKAS